MNIEILQKSRLPDVYRLAHEANVRAGHINPKPDQFFIQNRALDESEDTTIIGALDGAELVGTCTVTANGRHGLLADKHFPHEYGIILFEFSRLGAFWRMATKKESPKLILGLIKAALEAAREMSIETMVFMCTKDHAETYEKLVSAETVAQKTIHFEAQSVAASLMLLDVRVGLAKISRGKQQ